MRHAKLLGLLVVCAGVVSSAVGGQEPSDNAGFTPLFNGKDLTGFKTFLDPKVGDADPAKTWTVEDGTIRCSGKPTGFFYTDGFLTNYVLRYDWRYPAGSSPESNSGCLVHIQPTLRIWPKSVEPQGRYKDHGK